MIQMLLILISMLIPHSQCINIAIPLCILTTVPNKMWPYYSLVLLCTKELLKVHLKGFINITLFDIKLMTLLLLPSIHRCVKFSPGIFCWALSHYFSITWLISLSPIIDLTGRDLSLLRSSQCCQYSTLWYWLPHQCCFLSHGIIIQNSWHQTRK